MKASWQTYTSNRKQFGKAFNTQNVLSFLNAMFVYFQTRTLNFCPEWT